MDDLISRQAAIDALAKHEKSKGHNYTFFVDVVCECAEIIWDIPPAQRWIPFKTRPLTEEEREDHPGWDGILNCKLPDDGQRILVSINLRGHEEVQQDVFYSDDGCCLDSGYEIGTEAVAWMPLPEPWKGEEE